MIPIQNRINFKEQWHRSVAAGASLELSCFIDKIDYMVVNERKYRVKIQLSIKARQFTDSKIDFFEGLIEETKLNEENESLLREFIQNRNFFGVEELLASVCNVVKGILA